MPTLRKLAPALLPALALASCAWAVPAHADPARELVIGLAAPPRGTTAGRAAAVDPGARLAARLDALGLRLRMTLQQDLPFPVRLTRAGMTDPDPDTNPFYTPPDRVWLVEARDPAHAKAALAALAEEPAVEWAEPNLVRTVAATRIGDGPPGAAGADAPAAPDDPLLRDGRQWGLLNLGSLSPYGGAPGADIQALRAWTLCAGSNDVILGVADTGIDPDHPDLAAVMPDGSPRLFSPANLSGEEDFYAWADSFGHGTPVAGVMAALTNDGAHFDSLGVAGACGGDGRGNLGCRLMPIKIAPGHTGYATSFAIARAAFYAANLGARVLNLSFAGDTPSRVERGALYYALLRGCVLVAAAGNRGYLDGAGPQYPAAYAEEGLCIQVGATDPADGRASFSSYGPGLDLMAPGVNIWTTFMTYPSAAGASYPGYVAGSGTSFAAPFVAGAAGLLAAARPELIDVDYQHLLRESAHDIGVAGVDAETGWGRLDAAAALEAVGPTIGIWHDEVAGQTARALGSDTLVVGTGGVGSFDRWFGSDYAERIEITASVAIPDSFLGPVRIWPRVGGTFTVRGDYRMPYFTPWAEVAGPGADAPGQTPPAGMQGQAGSFTLRGYLYRLLNADCTDCVEDIYLPVTPDQARFGFTVIGPVDRPPTVALLSPRAQGAVARGDTLSVDWSATDPDGVSAVEVSLLSGAGTVLQTVRVEGNPGRAEIAVPCAAAPGTARLRVTAFDEQGAQHDQASAEEDLAVVDGPCLEPVATLTFGPNPSRGETWFQGPAGARVRIHDLAGRAVRELTLDARGSARWDGRDSGGRALPPGLYLVRTPGEQRSARLVRVE